MSICFFIRYTAISVYKIAQSCPLPPLWKRVRFDYAHRPRFIFVLFHLSILRFHYRFDLFRQAQQPPLTDRSMVAERRLPSGVEVSRRESKHIFQFLSLCLFFARSIAKPYCLPISHVCLPIQCLSEILLPILLFWFAKEPCRAGRVCIQLHICLYLSARSVQRVHHLLTCKAKSQS